MAHADGQLNRRKDGLEVAQAGVDHSRPCRQLRLRHGLLGVALLLGGDVGEELRVLRGTAVERCEAGHDRRVRVGLLVGGDLRRQAGVLPRTALERREAGIKVGIGPARSGWPCARDRVPECFD